MKEKLAILQQAALILQELADSEDAGQDSTAFYAKGAVSEVTRVAGNLEYAIYHEWR